MFVSATYARLSFFLLLYVTHSSGARTVEAYSSATPGILMNIKRFYPLYVAPDKEYDSEGDRYPENVPQ